MTRARRLAFLALLLGSVSLCFGQDKVDQPPVGPQPHIAALSPLTVPVGEWLSLFDGQTLSGWMIPKEIDFQQAGKVEVKEGAIQLAEGGPYTGITWEGSFPTQDFEVAWDGMRPGGFDIFGGCTVPVGDSHVTFVPGGWSDSVIGLSSVDGQNASENSSSKGRSFENKRWYRFCIRVTADKIQVWIDDQMVIDQERAGHTFTIYSQLDPNKPLGFFTWYTQGALRNIRMRRIPPEP